jgi:hypothetical protein
MVNLICFKSIKYVLYNIYFPLSTMLIKYNIDSNYTDKIVLTK